MRGSGELLGTRQHGHIAAIGFHLYTRLLSQAVRRLKGDGRAPDLPGAIQLPPVSIDLPLSSAIPAEYVADRDLRLQLYRRLAELRSEAELEALASEFGDRFGPMPTEVENLLYQLRLKILAARSGVEAISVENGQVFLLFPDPEGDKEIPNLGPDVRRSKRGLWLSRQGTTEWRLRLLEVLQALASLPDQ
jgi:transcription-repair coupling factor (superfamily II helicase)